MPRAVLLRVVLILAAVFAVAACGRPTVGSFPAESQPKLASVRHWEILADEAAGRVKKAVDANPEISVTPIDVAPQCSGPFCEVYGQLLASKLVSRGLQVASREEGVMALRFRAQVVGAEDRAGRAASESTLAIGSGAPAGSGTMEVAVTSELVYQNRFLMHHTGVYYVDAAESALYGKPLAPGIQRGVQRPLQPCRQLIEPQHQPFKGVTHGFKPTSGHKQALCRPLGSAPEETAQPLILLVDAHTQGRAVRRQQFGRGAGCRCP
mgnify:CR=1 FL=1